MSNPVLTRALRRETHSPRSAATAIVAVIIMLVLAYLAVEIILDLAGQPALLVSPGALLAATADVSTFAPGAVGAAGVVLALAGLVLVSLALGPGRLAKHAMTLDERAVSVDNGVIASSLAQRVSDELGMDRRRVEVEVGVGHRSVDVAVRPVLGVQIDSDEVRAIVDDELASYRLARTLSTRVRIERSSDREIDS